ncbi:MAG: Mut7-C RNAse domain-containing protein [Brevinematia bacterium]
MNKVYIRLYGGLNKLVSLKFQNKVEYDFLLPTTVKDIIESMGIPHTEVSLILLDNHSVGWDTKVKNNSRISFFPFFYSFDVSKLSKVYVTPKKLKFICDVHLGKLAKYLRILGFDCLYRNNLSDEEIINTGVKEKRIILTMDRGILKNGKVKFGALISNKKLKEQLIELNDRFQIYSKAKILSRCIICNKKLIKVNRKKASERFNYLKDKYYKDFLYCKECKRIYYKGSHYKKMLNFLENLL